MALITPNPNGSGDGLDDELTDGDIILRDENGNEIHFQPLEWNEEAQEDEIEKNDRNEKKGKVKK